MDKKRGYAWSEDAPNKGAFGLTFMNSRHYKQYLTLIAGFRAWAKANHNIDFTYKIAKKVPYDGYTNPKLLNVPTPDSDSENSYNDTYENVGENSFLNTLQKNVLSPKIINFTNQPIRRGFLYPKMINII